MNKNKIKKLVKEEGLDLYDLIDVIVDINAFIGVGLISLGDSLQEYCHDKIKRKV